MEETEKEGQRQKGTKTNKETKCAKVKKEQRKMTRRNIDDK